MTWYLTYKNLQQDMNIISYMMTTIEVKNDAIKEIHS